MEKKISVIIGSNEYDFNTIVKRSKRAPVIEVKTSFFKQTKPSNINEVDDSELRVFKNNNKFVLLTGYNKINEALSNSMEIVNAKLMSAKYLESAMVKPKPLDNKDLKDKTLVDKFAAAGFRVKVTNSN
jgi:hypothetical protein